MGSNNEEIDLIIKHCQEQASFCERHVAEATNKVAKDTFAEVAKTSRECAASFALLKELEVDRSSTPASVIDPREHPAD